MAASARDRLLVPPRRHPRRREAAPGRRRRAPLRRPARAGRATTETLDAAGARAIADSPRFLGGVFDTDSAICQPARLARGLRRVLLERGVHVFERTAMTGLDRERPAIVRTDRGAVRAEHVVLTTGAWAASWPAFRRSFGVISDYVVATEPMPERLQEIGWTHTCGDLRPARVALLPAPDRRRADRDRRRGRRRRVRRPREQPGGGAPSATSPRSRPAACSRCSRSSRGSGSPTRGEGRSTRRRRSCRSTERSPRATCTRGSGSAVTGLVADVRRRADPRVDRAWRSTTSGRRSRSTDRRPRWRRPSPSGSPL